MNMYLSSKRIAFLVLSLLSFIFALICTFAKGWSTYKGRNYGLFSPEIAKDNVCGKVIANDPNCLEWFRGVQALMLLSLLSHIVTVIGVVLAEKKNMRFLPAGVGQFAVGVFSILGLIVYSFQAPYAKGVAGFDLGWSFKLSWVICITSLIAAVIGITDGTKGEGMKL